MSTSNLNSFSSPCHDLYEKRVFLPALAQINKPSRLKDVYSSRRLTISTIYLKKEFYLTNVLKNSFVGCERLIIFIDHVFLLKNKT